MFSTAFSDDHHQAVSYFQRKAKNSMVRKVKNVIMILNRRPMAESIIKYLTKVCCQQEEGSGKGLNTRGHYWDSGLSISVYVLR